MTDTHNDKLAISIAEQSMEAIHSAFDWDGVPDSDWEKLSVRLTEIAANSLSERSSREGEIAELRAALKGLRENLGAASLRRNEIGKRVRDAADAALNRSAKL